MALKENIRVEGKRDVQTKVMTTLFALFAEVERDLISERVNEPRELTEIEARSVQRPPSEEADPSGAKVRLRTVGSEPDVGVGHARSGYPRETERRAGPDGVVDDDESKRAFGRATTRVPRKARLAHAATVGPVGVGCCARRAWRRRHRRAGTTFGWALTLAARESSAPQRWSTWRAAWNGSSSARVR